MQSYSLSKLKLQDKARYYFPVPKHSSCNEISRWLLASINKATVVTLGLASL